MKWISHKATAAAVSYALTKDAVFVFIATVASVIPDSIEFGPAGKLIFKKHRGLSHSLVFWFILFFIYLTIDYLYINSTNIRKVMFPLFTGIFIHLFTDALSVSGIPICGKHKIAAKFYKTSSFSEFLCATIIIILAIGIRFFLIDNTFILKKQFLILKQTILSFINHIFSYFYIFH